MKTPQTVFLKDYQVPDYLISNVDLTFDLEEEATTVTSVLTVKRNDVSMQKNAPLILDGEQLELISIKIDEKKLTNQDYKLTDKTLTIDNVPESFHLECITKIEPQKNLSLEGLYKSSGIFCTQCEAQGFRKITYYLDRPDVMAIFTTTIIADKKKYPILLSNGNKIATQSMSDGKHLAKWRDPFKKPAYLYALVAGDLGEVTDSYITKSGKKVDLKIFVNKGNEDRCAHAMSSLKRAMKWDEDTYGLEYDLDIFMIVAVDDFNFGAMENKGLNIFNSNYILAKPSTATDGDYEAIESVVGHEYFHNWTGNRVTCRDWFQLSLKEGLTVYRDQEFSSDMGSRAVVRIANVKHLRNFQFTEDAGPMAHPIRPASYMEINNFYTLTVYEKGAEVIRMIATILGKEGFRKGINKYFSLYDGQAVTTEDFIYAMEQANNIDLSQFRNTWYNQAGTPVLKIKGEYNANKKEFLLSIEQNCPPSFGQEDKKPYHIPLSIGLLNSNGEEVKTAILEIKNEKEKFTIPSLLDKPIPSLLRDFSAPVKVEYDYTDQELLFLLTKDTNSFSKWEAAQKIYEKTLQKLIDSHQQGHVLLVEDRISQAFGEILNSNSKDNALTAQLLNLPDEAYLAQKQKIINPESIHAAREFLCSELVKRNEKQFFSMYEKLCVSNVYQYNAEEVGKRSLKNTILKLLLQNEVVEYQKIALSQFRNSNNMTDEMAALTALNQNNTSERETAIKEFYDKWSKENLIMNKWLSLQANSKVPGGLKRIKFLMNDPVFNINNPNKVYSLFVQFGMMNLVQFHDPSGEAYEFFADQVLVIDKKNPSVAARIVSIFNQWKLFDENRKSLMHKQLERIMKQDKISTGVYEIVSKNLQ